MGSNGIVSIVIPVYNEKDALEELIKRCLASCREMHRPFEIILVDDGSSDGSRDIIKASAEQYKDKVVGVLLNRNYGQHAAIMAGFEQSRGEIVVTLDADLQNPPEEIPRIVQHMENGVDVVGTKRVNRQDNLFRRLASLLVNKITQKYTGVMMHDYGCMLRGYSRHTVNAMLQCRERSTFIPILANSFASKTVEIDVSHSERTKGESKYSLVKLINLQFDLLTSISTLPLRMLSFLGLLVSGAGIGFGIYIAIMRMILGPQWAAEGVFTLFAILFVFVGVQFIGMGLLGEYIGRIYNDVRARPKYFVSEVVGGPED